MKDETLTIIKEFSLVILLSAIFLTTAAEGQSTIFSITPYLVLFLFPLGGLFSFRRKSRYTSFLLLVLEFILVLNANSPRVTAASSGLPLKDIVRIEGTLAYDSTISENGNGVIRINMDKGMDIFGNEANCNGLVCAVHKGKELISAGSRVSLEGKFSENLFICDNLRVLGRSGFNAMRETIIERMMVRIGKGDEPSSELSLQLLLGRSNDEGFSLKEKAKDCGCSHILALSGMHLGILASICRVFPKRRIAKTLSYPIIILFLMAAGPRSSLIRAALMFFLPIRNTKERLLVSILLQFLLFPYSINDLGTIYGYCAILGIVFIAPAVTAFLSSFIGDLLAGTIGSTICALLICAPVQLISDGLWHPAALVLSAPAGLLAAASMLLGLLMLAFGTNRAFLFLNNSVYGMFEKLFDIGSRIPSLGLAGYSVFLGLVLTFSILSLMLPSRLTYGQKNNYTLCDDLGFRLQLGFSDNGSSGGKRSLHDEEVRTELPHLNAGSGQNHVPEPGKGRLKGLGSRSWNRSPDNKASQDGSQGNRI